MPRPVLQSTSSSTSSSLVASTRRGSALTRDGASRFFSTRDNPPDAGSSAAPLRAPASLPTNRFASSSRTIDDCRADVCITLHGTLVDGSSGARSLDGGDALDSDGGSESGKQQPSPVATTSSSPSLVPVEVVRLVNHVPLPDSAAAVACSMCVALSSLPVARTLEDVLGLKPRGQTQYTTDPTGPTIHFDVTDLAVSTVATSPLPTDASGASFSPASVVLKRPGCPRGLGGGQALRLTLVIDIQGDDLSFGSLDKCALANQTEYVAAMCNLLITICNLYH